MQNPLTQQAQEIPDLPEPIVAYRAWNITWPKSWQPALSGFCGTTWPTNGPLEAECMMGKENSVYGFKSPNSAMMVTSVINGVIQVHELDETPCEHPPSAPVQTVFGARPTGHVGYGCGIYAYKTPGEMLRHCNRGDLYVWGRVLLWGKVFDHKGGYRAQYGQIHSFIPMFESIWGEFADPEAHEKAFYPHPSNWGVPAAMINRSPLRLRLLSAITGIPLVALQEDPQDLLTSIVEERAEEKRQREAQQAAYEARLANHDAWTKMLEIINKISSGTDDDDDEKDEGEDDGRDRKSGS